MSYFPAIIYRLFTDNEKKKRVEKLLDKEKFVLTMNRYSVRVLISDLNIVKDLLVKNDKNLKKTYDYDPLKPLGENLIISEGETWKKQRVAFNPFFTQDNQCEYIGKMTLEKLDIFTKHWFQKDSNEIDIRNALNNLILDIISETAFGYNTHAIEEKKFKDFKKEEIPSGVTQTLSSALLKAIPLSLLISIFGRNLPKLFPNADLRNVSLKKLKLEY